MLDRTRKAEYYDSMAKRRKTERADFNALTPGIVRRVTGGSLFKNPAAVALGKLGGLKGGRARAEKLSPERRAEIAQKAAKARWSSHSRKGE